MTPSNDADRALTRADFDTRADWLRYCRAGCVLPEDETHPDFQDAMKLLWEKDDADETRT